MGPGKPVVFASTKPGRRQLRAKAREAGEAGARGLARHWRDLGSHARTDAREVGVTAACRVSKASRVAPSITGLPAGQWLLNKVLAQKFLAMALYGAEATPLPERMLQQLMGAFLGVVKAQCSLCATAAVVFQECATRGHELDPELLVALNRIDMLRKVWHKMPA